MRAAVQRVTRAKVTVDDQIVGEIGKGLVVLLGIARDDTKLDAAYLAEKITALRIFDDDEGKMNLSVKEVNGGVLIVSQFTLYDFFVRQTGTLISEVATGSFRAMMQVELVNDGPVTILLDSKKLF